MLWLPYVSNFLKMDVVEVMFSHFFKKFIFRERGREGERQREASMCGGLLHAPN